MKHILLALLACSLIGCRTPSGKIESKSLVENQSNVNINLSYPHGVDYPAGEQINPIMDTLIRSYLTWDEHINFDLPYSALIHLLDTTFASYEVENMVFDLDVHWYGYQNNDILSLLTTAMIYSGGAHPNTFLTTHNFNQKTGKSFDILSMIDDQDGFRRLLIDNFIATRDLPNNPTMDQTGLLIELSDLPISNNILLTDKGLEVIYNQYDIAPYYEGQIILTISYDMVKFKSGIAVDGLRIIGNEAK